MFNYFSYLPLDIVIYIMEYNGKRFLNGKFIPNLISKKDDRYNLLSTLAIPHFYDICYMHDFTCYNIKLKKASFKLYHNIKTNEYKYVFSFIKYPCHLSKRYEYLMN
jgi:hypothetical protein